MAVGFTATSAAVGGASGGSVVAHQPQDGSGAEWWQLLHDPAGRPYYHHRGLGTTQWECPAGFDPASAAAVSTSRGMRTVPCHACGYHHVDKIWIWMAAGSS